VLSFLKRKEPPAAASAVDPAASVESARTRARRRLIGAAVLVGVGIIGFPLLFETQPRPIAVDIPIEIPSREGASALSMPGPKNGTPTTPRAAAPVVAEGPVEAPVEPAAIASPASAAAAASTSARDTVPASAAAGRGASTPPIAVRRDAQRAQALLDGKAVASATLPPDAAGAEASTARFVVQAGAYTDATALRDARQRLERLGLKTYTQVIETESGQRTRVRVGPFATREEAEKAAVRIKGSGLAANILSL
jgi:DedD protein